MEEIFDKVDVKTIVIEHDGQRAISDAAWNDYIAKISDHKLAELVTKVRKQTVYISWGEFLKNLDHSFDMFSKKIENRPFKLYLPSDKFGSEYVFAALLWGRIKNLNCIGIIGINGPVNDGDHILFIDDAIYSGHSLMYQIDMLSMNAKIIYHAVIPYVSSMVVDFKQSFPHLHGIFYATKLIPTISVAGNAPFNQYMHSLVPLYFDHKVAGSCSTFHLIYMKSIGIKENKILLPIAPDTDIKTRLYKLYFQGLVPAPQELNYILS